jgi:hypothetical protein
MPELPSAESTHPAAFMARFQQLPLEGQEEFDQLVFRGELMQGLLWLKSQFDMDLKACIEMLTWRHDVLRLCEPSRFLKSPQDYWAGFYS